MQAADVVRVKSGRYWVRGMCVFLTILGILVAVGITVLNKAVERAYASELSSVLHSFLSLGEGYALMARYVFQDAFDGVLCCVSWRCPARLTGCASARAQCSVSCVGRTCPCPG